MKRSLTIILMLALGIMYCLPVHAAGMKIAYVDLQRALMEVSEGKLAKAKLKVYFDAQQIQLDGESERLKGMKEDLDRQGMMIDPKIKAEKEAALQKSLMELQKVYYTLQNELKQKENEAVAPILERMQDILKGIAQKSGYDLILDKNNSGIVYAPMKFDLTTELIRVYDKKYPVSPAQFKKAEKGK